MRRLLRRLGTFLLFLTVAICFAPTIVPIFLDRIYYRGPESGHFNSGRFFNPDDAHAKAKRGGPLRYVNRWLRGDGRAAWPKQVPVRPQAASAVTSLCATEALEAWMRCQTIRHSGAMFVTWIGHSTVLVQVNGLNILTDPIWSERASPFAFVGPRRVRRPGISFERLPHIDLILVSHNHYDHMDLPTLKRLWERDHPLIVTGLGNDSILKSAGIEAVAADWGESVSQWRHCAAEIDPCQPPELKITVERVHHWSSRWGSDRNRALWSGFTVHLPGGNIFFAGDSGRGDGSWVSEAARRGPIRLVILPIGAYEPRDVMQANHVNPEEAVAAFEGLRPALALGVHWGTFQLTFEPIGDPPRRLAAALAARGIAPGRFVTTEPGRSFLVPPLPPGRAGAARAGGSGSAAESRPSGSRRR